MTDNPPFVGVVTFNPIGTLRFSLLEATLRSIEKAFPIAELFLLDNGSTDGSWDAVCELAGPAAVPCVDCGGRTTCGRWHLRARRGPNGSVADENFTPGAGRRWLYYHMYGHLLPRAAPFWVWSDDDMVWREGAESTLRRFWADAPAGVAIVSGLLEPVWHWNTPRETVEGGQVRVLVRDSAPGAAWTFRDPHVVPVPYEANLMRFGYDYESCKMLLESGLRVAQMDLAEHIGWGCSTHGNNAPEHPSTRPLDRDKWGV